MSSSVNREFCPHCREFVASRTFRDHQKEFYVDGKWIIASRKRTVLESASEEQRSPKLDRANAPILQPLTDGPTIELDTYQNEQVSCRIHATIMRHNY